MKKEIFYRVFRIILVILFVVFISNVRNSVKQNYDAAGGIIDSMPKFVVTSLDNSIDKSNGLLEEHSVKIKNTSNKKENITFLLKDENGSFPYGYMNYTIIKDGHPIQNGVVTENDVLYSTVLSKGEDSVYKIIFSIKKEDIYSLGGVSTSAEIVFI